MHDGPGARFQPVDNGPVRFDAVVIAGGGARRLGGIDKPALRLGGQRLLDRVLDAVRAAQRRVVVGPTRAADAAVVWCREDPPGGGPLAALAAGLTRTAAPAVVVLGADLPWIAPAVPALLVALEVSADDAAALVDVTGRANLLAAAWRRPALLRAVDALRPVQDRPIRLLAEHARIGQVADASGWAEDCDTWDDLAAARRRVAEQLTEGSAP